jgi:hypothetical protein
VEKREITIDENVCLLPGHACGGSMHWISAFGLVLKKSDTMKSYTQMNIPQRQKRITMNNLPIRSKLIYPLYFNMLWYSQNPDARQSGTGLKSVIILSPSSI